MNKNSPHTIDPKAHYEEYGCVQCQDWHVTGDALFEEHKFWQSKHGIRDLSGAELLHRIKVLSAAKN